MEPNTKKVGVFVYGMPGSGKSRFLAKILSELKIGGHPFIETKGWYLAKPASDKFYLEFNSEEFYFVEFVPLVSRTQNNLEKAMIDTRRFMAKKIQENDLGYLIIFYCQNSLVQFSYEVEFFLELFPQVLKKHLCLIMTFADQRSEDIDEIFSEYQTINIKKQFYHEIFQSKKFPAECLRNRGGEIEHYKIQLNRTPRYLLIGKNSDVLDIDIMENSLLGHDIFWLQEPVNFPVNFDFLQTHHKFESVFIFSDIDQNKIGVFQKLSKKYSNRVKILLEEDILILDNEGNLDLRRKKKGVLESIGDLLF